MDKIKHATSALTFGGVGTCFKKLSSQGYIFCRGVASLSMGQSFALGAAIYLISHVIQRIMQRIFLTQKTAIADKPPAPLGLRKEAAITLLSGVVSNLLFVGFSASSAATGGALAAVAFVAFKVAEMTLIHFYNQTKPPFEKEPTTPTPTPTPKTYSAINNNFIEKIDFEIEEDPVLIEENLIEKTVKLPKELSEEEHKLYTALKDHPLTPNFTELKTETTDEKTLKTLSNYTLNEKIQPSLRRYFLASLIERMIAHQLYNENEIPDFGCKKFIPPDVLSQMKLLSSIYKDEPLNDYFIDNGIPDLDKVESFTKSEKTTYNRGFQNTRELLETENYVQLDLKDTLSFTEKILNCKKSPCAKKPGFYINIGNPVPKNFWNKLMKFAGDKNVDHFYLLAPGPLPLFPNDLMERDLSNLLQKLRLDPLGIYHLAPLSMDDFYSIGKIEMLRALCPKITPAKVKDTEIQDYSGWDFDVFKGWMPILKPTQIRFPRGMEYEQLRQLKNENLLSAMTHLDFSSVSVNKDFYSYLYELTFDKNISFTLASDLKFDPSDWLLDNANLFDNPIVLRRKLFSTETPKKENIWASWCHKLYNGDWNDASVFLIPAGLAGKLKGYPTLWKSLDPCTVSLWLYNDAYTSMPVNPYITEINAYKNGRLNDKNIKSFLSKFSKVKKVCLTGTAVTKEYLEKLEDLKIEFIFEPSKPEPIYTILTIDNAKEMYDKLVEDYKIKISELFYEWQVEFDWNTPLEKLQKLFEQNAKIRIDSSMNQEKSTAIFAKGLQLRDCRLFIETFCPEKLDLTDLNNVCQQPNFAFLFDQKMLVVNKNHMLNKCPDFKFMQSKEISHNWQVAMAVGGTLSTEYLSVIDNEMAKGFSLQMLEFIWNCCLLSRDKDKDILTKKVDQFFRFDFKKASATDCQNHLNSIETLLRFSKQWNATVLSNHLYESLVKRTDHLIPEDIEDECKGVIITSFLIELMTHLSLDDQDIRNKRRVFFAIWEIFKRKKLTEGQNEIIIKTWHSYHQQEITLPEPPDPPSFFN